MSLNGDERIEEDDEDDGDSDVDEDNDDEIDETVNKGIPDEVKAECVTGKATLCTEFVCCVVPVRSKSAARCVSQLVASSTSLHLLTSASPSDTSCLNCSTLLACPTSQSDISSAVVTSFTLTWGNINHTLNLS